jgi:hypothetical protein
VLNNLYMSWVREKDSQGLNGSMITQLDVPVEGKSGITERDLYVVDLVKDMTRYHHLIALQECSGPFLRELEAALPKHWALARMGGDEWGNQEVVLYHSLRFSLIDQEISSPYFSFPQRPVLSVRLHSLKTGGTIHIVNAHIPGDPNLPGKEEFASHVVGRSAQFPDDILIALGDHNFQREEMVSAYRTAGLEVGKDYTFWSPWNTNIDPYDRKTKAIDHIFIKGAKTSRPLAAEEMMSRKYKFFEALALFNRFTEQ